MYTPNYGGFRIADIIVKDNKTGEIIHIETKTGGADRKCDQIAKDNELVQGVNTTWGSKKIETNAKNQSTGIKKGDKILK